MRVDINLIAEKCKVSKATVSRVFTHKAGVRETVKERILKAARELNYTPKQMAAQENIAIITGPRRTTELSQFYPLLTADLITAVTGKGYSVKIISLDEADTLLGSYTKTAVLMTTGDALANYEARLENMCIPLIAVNRILPYAHSVCIDHYDEIKQAVDYLETRGHRKIALALDNDHDWAGKERIRGYREAMQEHKLESQPEFSYLAYNCSMVEVMANIRKSGASAAIVCGEGIAMQTVYAANLLDIAIPDELSLITFELKNFSQWFTPPHTAIDQRIDLLAGEIMNLIETLIQSHPDERLIKMLKSKLIVRQTVQDINAKNPLLNPSNSAKI